MLTLPAMYDIIAIGNPQYNLVLSQSKEPILSGPSVNVCSVAAVFGVERLALVGAIGSKFRERFVSELDALGISEYLSIESARTTEFQIACDEDGIQSQILLESAGPIKIKDIPDEFLRSELVVLAPTFKEIDFDFISWIAYSSDAKLIIDPLGLARTPTNGGEIGIAVDSRDFSKIVELADVVKMDWSLWQAYTKEKDPLLAAEFLVEAGADIGIVTLLGNGAVIFDGSDFLVIPFEKILSLNSASAEDAFLAGFSIGMLNNNTLLQCGTLGSSIASVIIEQRCADFTIDLDEVQRRNDVITSKVEIR
ncbi:MAG: PfkB family carbohydrate kinase [Candidatus Thorarchaeota archaeon]